LSEKLKEAKMRKAQEVWDAVCEVCANCELEDHEPKEKRKVEYVIAFAICEDGIGYMMCGDTDSRKMILSLGLLQEHLGDKYSEEPAIKMDAIV